MQDPPPNFESCIFGLINLTPNSNETHARHLRQPLLSFFIILSARSYLTLDSYTAHSIKGYAAHGFDKGINARAWGWNYAPRTLSALYSTTPWIF